MKVCFYQYYLNENDTKDKEDKEKKPKDSKLLENGGGDGSSMIPVKVNPFRALNQISPYAARVRKSMISIQTSVTV